MTGLFNVQGWTDHWLHWCCFDAFVKAIGDGVTVELPASGSHRFYELKNTRIRSCEDGNISYNYKAIKEDEGVKTCKTESQFDILFFFLTVGGAINVNKY